MALQEQDFLRESGGYLNPDWYPDVKLQLLVSKWLKEARRKTSEEEAQRAWVYYRGYRDKAERLNAKAAQQDLDGVGRERHLWEQIKEAKREAEAWRTDYDKLSASAPSGMYRRSPSRPNISKSEYRGSSRTLDERY